YLPVVELRTFRTKETDSREKVFLGNLFDHRVLTRLVIDDFGFADAGRTGWGTEPYEHRAAALDSFCLPAVAVGIDEDLIVRSHDEPHPSGLALIAVLSDGCNVDVASILKRGQIAGWGRCASYDGDARCDYD